mgnify:CR=1 FL=1
MAEEEHGLHGKRALKCVFELVYYLKVFNETNAFPEENKNESSAMK